MINGALTQKIIPPSYPPKTIVVQLHGGMGNQMFQAAAGMALAAKTGAHLIFDLSRFRKGGLRSYALAPFGLVVEVRPLGNSLQEKGARLINRLRGEKHRPPWWKGTIFKEAGFRYDKRFTILEADVLLSGYFQSPLYFAGYEAAIRAAFAPLSLASPSAQILAQRLMGEETASLHLRRGDYAKDARAAAIHGILNWDYYDKAVECLRSKVPNVRLFIISDDADAGKEAASRWPNAEPLAGQNAGDDFFLLSSARHHILANSTFAWWSAFLDSREGGITIAPKNWFAQKEAAETDDLMPKNWIVM